jgi:hypothetical protein
MNDLQENFQIIWKDYLDNHIQVRNSCIEIIGQAEIYRLR